MHQEIPINNELSFAFSRAFEYDNCTFAKEETKKDLYRVALAFACVASVERCRKMGNLQDDKILEHDS